MPKPFGRKQEPPPAPLAGLSRAGRSLKMLGPWAGAVLGPLGLAGALFGLCQVQENRGLRSRIGTLEGDRKEALRLLRTQKGRISELKSRLAALRDSASVSRKRGSPRITQSVPPAPSALNPATGLPLNFNNGTPKKKLVALTFDGAAYANAADDILDTLLSRRVLATMFLTGRFMRRLTDVLGRILAAGHEVGNHSYSHPHLTSWVQDRTHTTLPRVSEQYICGQLHRTEKTFRRICTRDMPRIWRAPYGEINSQLCKWAQNCGYLHIGWRQGRRWRDNLDSNDWVPDEETPGYHSPQQVYDKVMALAQAQPYGINGGIILMHLGTVRRDPAKQVHRILGRMIDDLRGLGYEFVTVSQLLEQSGVDLSALTTGSGGKS